MPLVTERSAIRSAHDASSSLPQANWRSSRWLILYFTAAGALLRLLHLGSKSLWQDEPLTAALARMSWPQLWHNVLHGEAGFQPAYFLLMHAWIRLGNSEFWLRLPSALFAIASIPLLYQLARRLIGDRAALFATALFAVSPTHVYYSQEARCYTMTIFLVLASTYFFVRAVDEGRERDWLLWVVFSALAFYSHLLACLVIVAQAASLVALRRRETWARMLVHGALILAFCVPGLVLATHVPAHDPSLPEWPRPTPKQLLHLALFLGGSGEKLLFSAILWIAALIAIWRERLQRTRPDIFWRGVLLVSWIVIPIVTLALISLRSPLFVQRYMIFSLPATIMLAGKGVTALPKRNLGAWLAVLLALFSVINIFMGYRKPREDWRAASAAVLSQAQPGDAVVVYPDYARTGYDYYHWQQTNAPPLQVFAKFYEEGEPHQALLDALKRNPDAYSRVFVLVRDQGAGRRTLPDYDSQAAQALQSTYGEPHLDSYYGVTVLRYGPLR